MIQKAWSIKDYTYLQVDFKNLQIREWKMKAVLRRAPNSKLLGYKQLENTEGSHKDIHIQAKETSSTLKQVQLCIQNFNKFPLQKKQIIYFYIVPKYGLIYLKWGGFSALGSCIQSCKHDIHHFKWNILFRKSFKIFFLFASLIQLSRKLTFCPIWVENKAT